MSKCVKCTLEIYMDKNICPVCGQVQNENLELLKNVKFTNNKVKLIPIILAFLVIVSLSIIYITRIPSVSSLDNAPIDLTKDPIQVTNSKTTAIYIKKGNNTFYLLPMADYEISAVVASKKIYAYDASSVLSPMDLLLIWGDLSNKKIKDNLVFSQYGRFGYCKAKTYDNQDLSYIPTHISNNHIIPSNNNIKKAINKLSLNDNLVITGYLVNVSGQYKSKDFVWESSLSRTDEGDGACEVIYVTKVKIGNIVYQ